MRYLAQVPADELKQLIELAKLKYLNKGTVECAEAVGSMGHIPLLCSRPAKRYILSERGKVIYPMCDACAYHNVKNRNCEDAGPIE